MILIEFGLGARSDNFRPLLGHGIFTQGGALWKTSRNSLRPHFIKIRSKSFGDIQREIEKIVSAIKGGPKTPDLQPLFLRLTMDTTMTVPCAKSLDSSEAQGVDEAAFARAFVLAKHQLPRRGRLGDLYWLLGGKDFRRSCKMVHDFVDQIVADAPAESPKSQAPVERNVFLHQLLSYTRDPLVLRDQLINVLLAGRDTTTCHLT